MLGTYQFASYASIIYLSLQCTDQRDESASYIDNQYVCEKLFCKYLRKYYTSNNTGVELVASWLGHWMWCGASMKWCMRVCFFTHWNFNNLLDILQTASGMPLVKWANLSVCQLATLRKRMNGFHQIFRIGHIWYNEQLILLWWDVQDHNMDVIM